MSCKHCNSKKHKTENCLKNYVRFDKCDHKLITWTPFRSISEEGWQNMGYQAKCSNCGKTMTNEDILK